jgi:ligand-binding sensor domain-containing protein/serine phosphatase RsbU (regulator of sigma subunit)
MHFHRNFRFSVILLSAFLSGSGISVNSQSYFFDNYSTQREFESKVYSIVQDNDQYLWLGTPTGVWKFDGRTFLNYTEDEGLSEGSVRVVFNDQSGFLWLGHEGGGISRKIGNHFERIALLDSVLRSNVTSINQDNHDNIWITTESDGALVIRNPQEDADKLKFEHYLQGKSLGDQVFSSLLTSGGDLYFITNVGIRKFNTSQNTFEVYLPEGLYTYFSISAMFEDSQGNIWFGTYNGGLTRINRNDKSMTYIDTRNGLASNWITCIMEDRKGNIWAGHWKDEMNAGGISCISPSDEITVFNTSNGLHDEHIWCIKEDHEGNILIGTTNQGLEVFKGKKFMSLTTREGLAHNQVNAITEGSAGEIWFGTNQGISVYSKQNGNSVFQYYNQSNKFISNQVNFFKKDRKGNIWIVTDEGITQFNKAKNRLVSQPQINNNLHYLITALEIGSEGNLWIGTIGALVEYDIEKDRYVSTYTQGSGLAGNEISAMFVDSKGRLWIGADKNKGVTLAHKGNFTIIKNAGEITPTCFTEDRNGRIWIGTKSDGIVVIDKDSILHYSAEDGLLSKHINLLYCDQNNNVYAGTNLGLNKIDQAKNKILSFTRNSGFAGIETKPNAWWLDSQGFLWIGTANGAMKCDLDLISTADTLKPVIRINELLIKGIPAELTEGRRLSSNQNDLTFGFSTVSLTNPEGITYYIMLEGFDDQWIVQKNTNSRVFNKLPAGRYVFRVKARNELGEWTSEPASYSFRILAPPYRRGYFIVTSICLILASIIAFIKIRERNLVNEKRILETRVTERTHELQEANTQLSMRNKDILDSITYAKRIQLAILPSEIPYKQTFILYKPKDIVSGDFYWLNSAGGREFLAAVDCTGHGVPGAFMSFIGYTSLNKIIIEQKIIKPSEILNRLNEEVATNLHQKGEAIVNDGMDISLICYSPVTGILEYAGAFNPLIIIRAGELIELKADRFAIGRATGKEKSFTNHEFLIEEGDCVYMYSDGYADQFGGPDGKKYKTSTLKELLLNISEFDAETQQKILETSFEDWKGTQGQIDDVLVMGRRF